MTALKKKLDDNKDIEPEKKKKKANDRKKRKDKLKKN